jgi:pimeloyl-ACP methyl ester carboxylesterase
MPVLFLTMVCGSVVRGQPPAKAVIQDGSLVTKDGQEIKITYFKSNAGQEAPVVILLHGKSSNRLVWKPFAEQLQKVDFAVVTVDLRGHGESGGGTSGKKPESAPKAREFIGMVAGDLEAVKKFLYEEHQNKQLNMNKLGIVAADITAPVAIAFAELDWEKKPYDDAPTLALSTPRGQDVQALVLLSPEGNVPGLGTAKSLAIIRNLNRAVLICVGSKNSGDVADARKMHEILDPKKEKPEQIYFEQYDSKLSGTDLIGKGFKTEPHIFNFLIKHVKGYRSEWRDRKSKLAD